MPQGGRLPVVWFQAAGCTGCSMSLMNAQYPHLTHLLLDEVVPGKPIALAFHATLMGPTGEPALRVVNRLGQANQPYVLVVEGAIPTASGGSFGVMADHTLAERTEALAGSAFAVLAVGTCAAYGGIPSGSPNPTGARGVGSVLREGGVSAPVVNVPGCPPHPRWFVETLAFVLTRGLPTAEDLDSAGRLKGVFRGLIHENCPRRADFEAGRFARNFGEEGCLYELGCKGPYAEAPCPWHRWNGGVNWCIQANHPCLACCEPDFPDRVSPIFQKIEAERAKDTLRSELCARSS